MLLKNFCIGILIVGVCVGIYRSQQKKTLAVTKSTQILVPKFAKQIEDKVGEATPTLKTDEALQAAQVKENIIPGLAQESLEKIDISKREEAIQKFTALHKQYLDVLGAITKRFPPLKATEAKKRATEDYKLKLVDLQDEYGLLNERANKVKRNMQTTWRLAKAKH